jgi:hypothetical protein
MKPNCSHSFVAVMSKIRLVMNDDTTAVVITIMYRDGQRVSVGNCCRGLGYIDA